MALTETNLQLRLALHEAEASPSTSFDFADDSGNNRAFRASSSTGFNGDEPLGRFAGVSFPNIDVHLVNQGSDISLTGDFTLHAVVEFDGVGGSDFDHDQVIFGSADGNTAFGFGPDTDGTAGETDRWLARIGGVSTYGTLNSPILLNRTYHVVFARKDGVLSIYIGEANFDSGDTAYVEQAATISNAATAVVNWLGAAGFGTDNSNMDGNLAYVVIWSEHKTPAQMDAEIPFTPYQLGWDVTSTTGIQSLSRASHLGANVKRSAFLLVHGGDGRDDNPPKTTNKAQVMNQTAHAPLYAVSGKNEQRGYCEDLFARGSRSVFVPYADVTAQDLQNACHVHVPQAPAGVEFNDPSIQANLQANVLNFLDGGAYNIDQDRVIGCSTSAGAMGLLRLAASMPDRFAALWIMAGHAPNDAEQSEQLALIPQLKDVPILWTHALNDQTLVEGGTLGPDYTDHSAQQKANHAAHIAAGGQSWMVVYNDSGAVLSDQHGRSMYYMGANAESPRSTVTDRDDADNAIGLAPGAYYAWLRDQARTSVLTAEEIAAAVLTDVDQEPVPEERTWEVIPNKSGWVGEKSKTAYVGVEATYAIDFSKDLATNGRITTVDAVNVLTGGSDGLTIGKTGRDKSRAHVRIKPASAGTYQIECRVSYKSGSEAVAVVELTAVDLPAAA